MGVNVFENRFSPLTITESVHDVSLSEDLGEKPGGNVIDDAGSVKDQNVVSPVIQEGKGKQKGKGWNAKSCK